MSSREEENAVIIEAMSRRDDIESAEQMSDIKKELDSYSVIRILEEPFRDHYLEILVKGPKTKQEADLFDKNWAIMCEGDSSREVFIVNKKGEALLRVPPLNRRIDPEYLFGKDGCVDMAKIAKEAMSESVISEISARSLLNKGLAHKVQELSENITKYTQDDFADFERIRKHYGVTDEDMIPGLDSAHDIKKAKQDADRGSSGAEDADDDRGSSGAKDADDDDHDGDEGFV